MSDNKEFNNSMQLICPKELVRARYIKPSGLSYDDAKKIALANNVIWDVI